MKPVDYNVYSKTPQELLESFMKLNDSEWYIKPLLEYAKDCKIIAEFGIFQGQTIAAFLTLEPEQIRAYDIDLSLYAHGLFDDLKGKTYLSVVQLDTTKHGLSSNVDFLFVDTRHVYEHVLTELSLHHIFVDKYIAIHDTQYPPLEKRKAPFTNYPHKLVRDAVLEFCSKTKNPYYEWKVVYEDTTHSGLMIVEKVKLK